MSFNNETKAYNLLSNISYYRLKGYWWDMQSDNSNRVFRPNTQFETVIECYNFDRRLRRIVFDAIERIEISLRTKIIYHLSARFGGLWYLNNAIVENVATRVELVEKLKEEFSRSNEIFVKDHKDRLSNFEPDAWEIFEVASMGTLSKFYKNLKHQLPEKSIIANEMGLNLHSELSSWLESFTYVRNIVAHHSRLWNRTMVKRPLQIVNPSGPWLQETLIPVQLKKPFFIISSMLYVCNKVNL